MRIEKQNQLGWEQLVNSGAIAVEALDPYVTEITVDGINPLTGDQVRFRVALTGNEIGMIFRMTRKVMPK